MIFLEVRLQMQRRATRRNIEAHLGPENLEMRANSLDTSYEQLRKMSGATTQVDPK